MLCSAMAACRLLFGRPSGIRMDCGTVAFAMPNGTCLAATFNEGLSEELYSMEGLELRKNHVDTLLGPGINIHRHPLNGRNFEYFSEDPLLTGKMACAQLRGMHRWGVTGTIKHLQRTIRSTGVTSLNRLYRNVLCGKSICAALKLPSKRGMPAPL